MTVEKKNRYDTTSTQRQAAHLVKLAETKGKRLPVDLDGDRLGKLAALVEAGYGDSQAGAIRRAIDDAFKKTFKGR